MVITADPASRLRRRLRFGIVAILASSTIATLIATGLARPHPSLEFAYLICVAVGIFGLIQLILAIAGSAAVRR